MQIKAAVKTLYDIDVAKINTLVRPDGQKKAYIRLTPDHDALEVANKVGSDIDALPSVARRVRCEEAELPCVIFHVVSYVARTVVSLTLFVDRHHLSGLLSLQGRSVWTTLWN